MGLAGGTSGAVLPDGQRERFSKRFAEEKDLGSARRAHRVLCVPQSHGDRTEINGCEPPMRSRLPHIHVREGGTFYHQARQPACRIGAGIDIDTVSPHLDFVARRMAMYDRLAEILV